MTNTITISLGLLKYLSPQLLRAYVYIRDRHSGKVKWDKAFQKELAKFLGVQENSLRPILHRLIRKGVVERGGQDWVFCIGAKRLHARLDSNKRAAMPWKAMRSKRALRDFSRKALLANVIKSYGYSGQNKKGRPVKYQPLAHDYVTRTLGWSRSTSRRYRNNKSGYLKVHRDYEIVDVSGQFRKKSTVIEQFFLWKSILPELHGDEFRSVNNMKLHTTRAKAEIRLEAPSVVYSNILILRPPR
jgi:hypothetical protein